MPFPSLTPSSRLTLFRKWCGSGPAPPRPARPKRPSLPGAFQEPSRSLPSRSPSRAKPKAVARLDKSAGPPSSKHK
eukprot:364433-Chlamydomonas_euryale.AAC.12